MVYRIRGSYDISHPRLDGNQRLAVEQLGWARGVYRPTGGVSAAGGRRRRPLPVPRGPAAERTTRRPGRKCSSRLDHGSYDLVHAQFGQSGLTALPKRVPLVVTFRGDDLEGIIGENGRYVPAGWLLRMISRTVARQADASIVVSEHMKRHLPALGGCPCSPVRDRPESVPTRAPRTRPAGDSDCRPTSAWCSSWAIPAWRASAMRWPSKRSSWSAARCLTRLVVGWEKPHQEIAALMNACDALVCTSMQEGSPNAVKEALACNLPVVSVPVGDVPLRLTRSRGLRALRQTIGWRPLRPAWNGCSDGAPGARAARRWRISMSALLTLRLIDIYRSVLAGAKALADRPASRGRPDPWSAEYAGCAASQASWH